jgi:hypothetical protein
MKRLFWVIVAAALAVPALPRIARSQDGGFEPLFSDDFGGFDNADNGGNRGGNRGNRGARGAAQPTVDRLKGLRNLMVKSNAPLTADEEKSLNTLLDTEFPAIQAKLLPLLPPSAFQDAQQGFRGQGRGGDRGTADGQVRGGRGGRGNATNPLAAAITANPDGPLATEATRLNDELLTKVAALLKPDQQTVIKKYQRDVTRSRGVFDLEAFKIVIEDAGAPSLTAEQVPQIEALYAEHKKARSDLMEASQGEPDKAKLSDLDLQTATKLSKLLNAAQRKALLEQMQKANAQPK